MQHFPGTQPLNFRQQAAELSDSINEQYPYKLYQWTKEGTLPNSPTGDIEGCCKQSNVFPGRTTVRGQLSEKENSSQEDYET